MSPSAASYKVRLLWKTAALKGTSFKLPVNLFSKGHKPLRLNLKPGVEQAYTFPSPTPVYVEARLPSGQHFRQMVPLPEALHSMPKPVIIQEPDLGHSSSVWRAHQDFGTLKLAAKPGAQEYSAKAGIAETLLKVHKATAQAAAETQVIPKTTKLAFRSSGSKTAEQVEMPALFAQASLRLWDYKAGSGDDAGRECSPWQQVHEPALSVVESFDEAVIFRLADSRLGKDRPLSTWPHRLLELHVPGCLSRFVVLPPVSELQVLLRLSTNPAAAAYAGGLTLKIVPSQTAKSRGTEQTILSYMSQQSFDEVNELAASLMQQQRQNVDAVRRSSEKGSLKTSKGNPNPPEKIVQAQAALAGKMTAPFAAELGCYYLIRTSQFKSLGDMPRNFYRWAPTLPDTALLYAWQLMTDPSPYSLEDESGALELEIKEALLETTRRGIPLFSMGLAFLFQRLRLIQDVMKDGALKLRIDGVVNQMGRLLDASEKDEQFTTFFGLSPWQPARYTHLIEPWAALPLPTSPAATLPLSAAMLSLSPHSACSSLTDEDTFIAEIKNELAGACGITPFLGSGVSAQSGIIMGEEFPKYLAWTVSQVLLKKWDLRQRGWPPFPSSDEKEKSHLYLLEQFKEWCRARNIEMTLSDSDDCPRITTLRVPEQQNHQEQIGGRDIHLMRPLVPEILRDVHIWDKEDFLDTAKRHLKILDEPTELNTPDSSEEYIVETALRALSHWTRTLEFLARVRLTTGAEPRLYLETAPDISVIDGFNAHITRGKRPNLTHNMISRLARSMRTRIILTTNFDTLLEQSYRAQGEPLHMLAVSIKGGLPSHATVHAQDCVVKLHGDILETRADTSINEPPTPADKQRFFQYLRGPNRPHKRQPDDFVPSHLLVLGYSASDPRCVQMIRYTLDMDPGFKVFWACHTPRDVQRVQRCFGTYGSRVRILQTDRTDLLLWELYQKLNLSLPGGGHSLQFTQQVPPRSTVFDEEAPEFQASVGKLHEFILRRSERKVVYIDCASRTTQPMQAVFGRFKKSHYHAAWFELEDYRNTDDLFFNLLSLISLNLGYFQLEWINFAPRRDKNQTEAKNISGRMNKDARKLRLKLLVEKFKINPERWVLFMYGRNGPGGCTGWGGASSYWDDKELADLDELLLFLSTVGFKVVYMPRGPLRAERDTSMLNKFREFLQTKIQNGKSKGNLPPPLPSQDKLASLHPKNEAKPHAEMVNLTDSEELAEARNSWGKAPNFVEILEKVVCEFGMPPTSEDDKETIANAQRSSRAIWLYGLTLLRQSRHPAAMISEAIFPCPWRFCENRPDGEERDNDEYRHKLIYENDPKLTEEGKPQGQSWMSYLQSKGLFLRKPGGNSWMYRDTRLGLQTFFESSGRISLYNQPFSKSPKKVHTFAGMRQIRARLHYWIGDWYLRAYYSSGHFIPLIEAIYHSAQAITHAPEYHWISGSEEERLESEFSERVSLVWKAVCQFRKLLLVGRRSLLFWCPGVDIKQCFFETDLSVLNEAINSVIKAPPQDGLWKKEATTQDGGGVDSICSKLERLAGGILQDEVNHLHEAVLKEAFAHGGRTSPVLGGLLLSGGSGEYVAPPDQAWKEVEPPVPLNEAAGATPPPDWRKNIVEKMLRVSEEPAEEGRPKKPVIMEGAELQSRFKGIIDKDDVATKTSLLTELRRTWLNQWGARSGDEATLFRMIWLISEMMYRILRRAKLEYHAASVTKQKSVPNDAFFMSGAEANVTHRWQIVSALGYQALQMCRSLSPDYHHADCDLRVRVLTLYAVSLGYLNRFSEANRRFNEAHAIILSGMGWPDGRELARIHIRRSEMLIWNSRHYSHGALARADKDLGPFQQELDKLDRNLTFARLDQTDTGKKKLQDYETKKKELSEKFGAQKKETYGKLVAEVKVAINLLDDSWAALERGELCLGGGSHSAYWWYRLLSQKLSCYAALGTLVSELRSRDVAFDFQFSCLPFRRRIHLPTTLLSLMRDALIVGAGDLFRQLRVLEYAMIADAALNPEDERVFSKNDARQRLFTQITHPELYQDVLRVLEYRDPEEEGSSKEEKEILTKLGPNMKKYHTKVCALWTEYTGHEPKLPL